MLLKIGQHNHLVADGEGKLKFVGHDVATDEEKRKLLELDESYLDIYDYHIITNYEDLKQS